MNKDNITLSPGTNTIFIQEDNQWVPITSYTDTPIVYDSQDLTWTIPDPTQELDNVTLKEEIKKPSLASKVLKSILNIIIG